MIKFKVGDKVQIITDKWDATSPIKQFGKKGIVLDTKCDYDINMPILVQLINSGHPDYDQLLYKENELQFDNSYLIKEKLGIK